MNKKNARLRDADRALALVFQGRRKPKTDGTSSPKKELEHEVCLTAKVCLFLDIYKFSADRLMFPHSKQ